MTDRPMLFSGTMVRAILDGRKTQTRRVLHVQPPEWVNFCEQPQMFNVSHQWVPSGLWRWAELDENRHRALRQWPIDGEGSHYWLRPRFAVGDRLYVREAWRTLHKFDCLAPRHLADDPSKVTFEADPERRNPLWAFGRLRPGMHMPRWASRLTLIVTDVRVERLQDISEADAIAEGIACENVIIGAHGDTGHHCEITADRYWNGTEDDDFEGHEAGEDAYADLWDRINAARGFGWDTNPWIATVTFTVHRANIDAMPAREAA